VLPECEGQGIGRGLLSEVLKGTDFTIYVHSHLIANRAAKLYSDFGFKLITDPIVGYRENNINVGLQYLEATLLEKDYANLQMTTANPDLLEAALLNEFAEF